MVAIAFKSLMTSPTDPNLQAQIDALQQQIDQLSQQRRPVRINVSDRAANIFGVVGGVLVAVWSAGQLLGVGEVRSGLYELNRDVGQLTGKVDQLSEEVGLLRADTDLLTEQIGQQSQALERIEQLLERGNAQ